MKIGIDMGGTNIRVGVVQAGVIIKQINKPTLADRGEKEILADLLAAIREVLNPQIKSIGIGVPSVVDIKKGIVYNVANIPSWKEVHLKEILEKEFNLPVSINNDANCFALGEFKHGKGKDFSSIVGLTIGTGVGSGLILDGKLYNGENTGAGEVGSIPYLDNEFEYYCSGQFFEQIHKVEGKDAAAKAEEGDEEALELFNKFGGHMGNLMKTILFAYDPQAIIIGGSIAQSYSFYSDAMYKVIDTFPYPATVNNLKIHISTEGDIGILGAAEL